MNEYQILEKLDNLLEQAIRQSSTNINQPLGVVFSGGVDSSLLAKICLDLKIPITLISAGVRGFFKDEPFVDSFAKELNLPLIKVVVEAGDIPPLIPKISTILEKIGINYQNQEFNPKCGWENHPLQVSLAMPFYLAARAGVAQGINTFACAQAGDELFGGGSSHLSVPPDQLNPVLSEAFNRLMEIDQVRDKAMFSNFGAQLLYPLADKEFSDYVLSLSPEYKIRVDLGEPGRKYIWRQLALRRGVPKENALRRKHAMQYSSGFWKEVVRVFSRSNTFPTV